MWNAGKLDKAMTGTQITEEEWERRFQPDWERGLVDPSDVPEDTDFGLVWTQVDLGSLEDVCYVSGWHFVNRTGHILCRQPVPAGEEYWVQIWEPLTQADNGELTVE